MILLLDTHLVLWAAGMPDRLSDEARELIDDATNALCFSAASLWEIAIESALGRADFLVDPALLRRGLRLNGWEEIPVTGEHALELVRLPPLHRDPFDRILLCQARVQGTTLLTSDAKLASYGAPARLV